MTIPPEMPGGGRHGIIMGYGYKGVSLSWDDEDRRHSLHRAEDVLEWMSRGEDTEHRRKAAAMRKDLEELPDRKVTPRLLTNTRLAESMVPGGAFRQGCTMATKLKTAAERIPRLAWDHHECACCMQLALAHCGLEGSVLGCEEAASLEVPGVRDNTGGQITHYCPQTDLYSTQWQDSAWRTTTATGNDVFALLEGALKLSPAKKKLVISMKPRELAARQKLREDALAHREAELWHGVDGGPACTCYAAGGGQRSPGEDLAMGGFSHIGTAEQARLRAASARAKADAAAHASKIGESIGPPDPTEDEPYRMRDDAAPVAYLPPEAGAVLTDPDDVI